MNKSIPYILIAILGILQFFSFREIGNLEYQVLNYQNQLNVLQSSMDGQINDIYNNVDKKLEEQASIIFKANTQLGEFDMETLTVPITFTVEPKQVSDQTTVSLKFNDETLKLSKNDITYSATKIFSLSEDEVFPSIIIEDNGMQSITQDKGLHIGSLVDETIPKLYPVSPFGFSISTRADSNLIEYHPSGELYIDGNYEAFENVHYVAYIDDNKVSETDIILSLFANGNPILPEYHTFELTRGQILETYIVAVDNLGLTHEYPLEHYKAGSDEQRESYYDAVKITAQDGRVIFDNTRDKDLEDKYEITYS